MDNSEDLMMYLIDAFIRLQLIAKNFPENERFDFLVKHYRQLLAEQFATQFPDKHHVYWDKISNTEEGPWAKDLFDLNNPHNLLENEIL